MDVDPSEIFEDELTVERKRMCSLEKQLFFCKFHPIYVFPMFVKKCKTCNCQRCMGPPEVQVLPKECVMRKSIERVIRRNRLRFVHIILKNQLERNRLLCRTETKRAYSGMKYITTSNYDILWVDDYVDDVPLSKMYYGEWVNKTTVWNTIPQKIISFFRDIQKIKPVMDRPTQQIFLNPSILPLDVGLVKERIMLVEHALFLQHFHNEALESCFASLLKEGLDPLFLASFADMRLETSEAAPACREDPRLGRVKFSDGVSADMLWIPSEGKVLYGGWLARGFCRDFAPERRLLSFFRLVHEMAPRWFEMGCLAFGDNPALDYDSDSY